MSNTKTFSFTKGYTFTFNDEGKEINAWFSSLTGLEKVYVDGEVVSSQRNLSTNSSNKFRVGANEYSTNMKAVSILKGPFVCTLNKNGQAYKRQRLVFPKLRTGKLSFFSTLGIYILIGVLFRIARNYWQLPKESGYLLFIVVFVAVFFYQFYFNRGLEPIIEDEEILIITDSVDG